MLKTLDKILTKFEEITVSMALFYSVLMISFSVLLRSFGHGIQWSDESVRYIMILAALVGCSLCVKRGAHICIDILEIVVPKKHYRYIQLLISIISCAFCSTMTVLGVITVNNSQVNPQLSPALQIPMWICYLVIPLGFGLTSLRYVVEIVKAAQRIIRGEVEEDTKRDVVPEFNG